MWVWGRAGRWKTAGILDVAVLHIMKSRLRDFTDAAETELLVTRSNRT